MNTLPRPKIHEDDNARARAYQHRRRLERKAAQALAQKLAVVDPSESYSVSQLLEGLEPEQRDALLHFGSLQVIVTNSSNLAD
jgi:hypothetical protein